MNMRAFDPLLLDRVDDCTIDEEEEISFVERCTICGVDNLVYEDGRLVDLDGEPHECATCPE